MPTKRAKARILVGWLLICLNLCLLWANYNLAKQLEQAQEELRIERVRFYELEGIYHGLIVDRIPNREGTR